MSRTAALATAAAEISSLCPTATRSFEFSQNAAFMKALVSLANIANAMPRIQSETPAIETARTALRAHPIYQWLQQKMPDTSLAMQDPIDELLRMLKVLACLLAMSETHWDGHKATRHSRPDKRRSAAASDIERVQRHLMDGTLDLPPNRGAHLWAQLVDAKAAMQRRRKVSKHSHPGALAVAALLNMCGLADAQFFLAICEFAEIDCNDERMAYRYLEASRPTAPT